MPSDDQLIEQFKNLDKDGNNELTSSEVGQLLKQNGFDNSFVEEFIKQFDIDGDGKVTLEEYKEKLGIFPPNQKSYSVWKQVFRDFDKDGSGKISATELQAILKEQSSTYDVEVLQKFLAGKDADGDGELNYDEFLSFIQNQKSS